MAGKCDRSFLGRFLARRKVWMGSKSAGSSHGVNGRRGVLRTRGLAVVMVADQRKENKRKRASMPSSLQNVRDTRTPRRTHRNLLDSEFFRFFPRRGLC